jgi:hypothetical protein
MLNLSCLLQSLTKRRSQRPGRPPKLSAAALAAAKAAAGRAPPLLRQPKRGGRRREASPAAPAPLHPAGSSTAAGPGSFPGSLVETAAWLGELHAELEAGHTRVQAAIAGEP